MERSMNAQAPARRPVWPRVLAIIAVVVVLVALAAAVFILSYSGLHAIALSAGVPVRLARYYPGILDAALLIACLAALLLRDARWWARWYAWLAIIVMVIAGGGVSAIHAMKVALPHRATTGAVAAAPWVLLLLAFSLCLTILRQSRTHRADGWTIEPVIGGPVDHPSDAADEAEAEGGAGAEEAAQPEEAAQLEEIVEGEVAATASADVVPVVADDAPAVVADDAPAVVANDVPAAFAAPLPAPVRRDYWDTDDDIVEPAGPRDDRPDDKPQLPFFSAPGIRGIQPAPIPLEDDAPEDDDSVE